MLGQQLARGGHSLHEQGCFLTPLQCPYNNPRPTLGKYFLEVHSFSSEKELYSAPLEEKDEFGVQGVFCYIWLQTGCIFCEQSKVKPIISGGARSLYALSITLIQEGYIHLFPCPLLYIVICCMRSMDFMTKICAIIAHRQPPHCARRKLRKLAVCNPWEVNTYYKIPF